MHLYLLKKNFLLSSWSNCHNSLVKWLSESSLSFRELLSELSELTSLTLWQNQVHILCACLFLNELQQELFSRFRTRILQFCFVPKRRLLNLF